MQRMSQTSNNVRLNGLCVGPDDVYLGLRGLRTLAVRLDRHHRSGLAVARWLEQRPEVLRLLHPAMASHPGHALWKRDFTGASGLFSVVLKPVPQKAVYAFLDTLELFGIGASWGGYESLAIPFDCTDVRTATRWAPGGPTIRFHIGLESGRRPASPISNTALRRLPTRRRLELAMPQAPHPADDLAGRRPQPAP